MLEGVLAWFINNYIGEYFDNVNTHQLSIAYGEGEIELENLPLRVEPFQRLGLPFEVKSGFVGRLRLTLRLRSEGCLVNIDELFIVCGPRSDFDFDATREDEREQEIKQRLLEALESKWKLSYEASCQDSSAYYPSYTSFLSFSTSLFTNFTENLQFRVRDVHLRYEDDSIDPTSPLVVGLQVKNLSVQSADDAWNPTFISSSSASSSPAITRKLVDLENFNVYWDTGVPLVKDLGRDVLVDQMRDFMSTPHEYLLDPVNGKAFISRNSSRDPLKSRSTPRISVDFQFQKIALSLNVLQYEQLLTVVDDFSRRQLILKNCRWRPKNGVKGHAREWWLYAVQVNLHEWKSQRMKENWSFALNRCTVIKKYYEVYMAIIVQPENVTRDMRSVKEEIENDLSFEEIRILRELVYDKFQQMCPPQLKEQSSSLGWTYLQSWLPSWFSSADTSIQETTDEGIENMSFSSNLEDDVIDVINNVADESLLTRDAVFAQLNFSVEKASAVLIADPLNLKSSPKRKVTHHGQMQHIMEFELSHPFFTVETLPRTSSQRFKAKFSELTLQDKVSSSTSFKYLIAPQSFSSTGSQRDVSTTRKGQLFELVFEKIWSPNLITNRLYMKIEPLRFVYNKSVLDVLYRFFSSKSYSKKESSSFLTQITRSRYESFKSQTKAGIQHAVEDLFVDHKSMKDVMFEKWEFDLNVSAPQIVLPGNTVEKSDSFSLLVVFDMGRLVFRNKILSHLKWESEDKDVFITPPSTPPSLEVDVSDSRKSSASLEGSQKDSSFSSLRALYQKYTVEVNDVQLLVAPTSDNWNFYLQKGSGTHHVFNRFSLTFDLQKRVSSVSPDLPRVILSGSLPQLFMFLNESKITSLQSCLSLLFGSGDKAHVLPTGSDSSMKETSDMASLSRQHALSSNKKIFFLTELTVKTFSIALQSRGENLVELQVFGVSGKLEKSKGCQTIFLSVSSLLMIDAHQKFGKEYQILLASHKHLLIDASRGTFTSSPPIPSSSSSASTAALSSKDKDHHHHHHHQQQQQEQQRVRSYSTAVTSISQYAVTPAEALISLKIVSDASKGKESIEVVFSNLDVIANQETLVELVAFFKRVSPSSSTFTSRSDSRSHSTTPSLSSPASSSSAPSSTSLSGIPADHVKRNRGGSSRYTEVKVDFRQLNVLLLRSIKMPEDRQDKKVATATFSGASITVKWGNEAVIEGSLKTMQVIGMSSPRGGKGEIVKIGPEQSSCGPSSHHSSSPKGISFTIKRTFSENMLDLNLSLVSLYYFHSPSLLRELSSCAEEFKMYMSVVAETIKSAAAEVAKELVSTPSKDRISSKVNPEKKLRKTSQSFVKELRLQCSIENPLIVLPCSHSLIRGLKKMTSAPPKEPPLQSDKLSFFECLAVGMDVKEGNVRIVDDQKPDHHLLEANVKELYLFHSSNGSAQHKGNIKGCISVDYFNHQKSGWEPLWESWRFVLRWNRKQDKVGKDGIMHRMSGSSAQSSLYIESEDTLNFNVTDTTLDLYYSLKDKWDAEIIDNDDGVLDIAALTASPSKFLSQKRRPDGHNNSSELKMIMDLNSIGFSFVNRLNEELLYLTLSAVLMEYTITDCKHCFNCSVRELQVDNQLRQHQKEVVIYQMPSEEGDPMNGQPALSISFQKTVVPHIYFFPEFQVKCKDIVFNLEELLLLKLYEFFGYPWEGMRALDRAVGHMASRVMSTAAVQPSSFIYVILFEIVLKQIRLSVYTSSHLPQELSRLKERLGLTLISFEDAKVHLEAFRRETSLQTINYLWTEIVTHYKKQLQRQAAKILGSVDFLGNPLGLMSDVSEGITDLIVEGNVGGLVTNITHGLSNSTAKFMSSLSNSLEVTTVDARHQEIRRRIQQDNRDHLRTGIRGLGVGLMGGVTSIVTQTFDGVKSDGLEGLVSGFGKGLLGTVTKPAVGMLDFATGAASAVRETIRKISHHSYQSRRRPPRVCVGPSGLLPPFDAEQAFGQKFFYTSSYITDREAHEVFESFHVVSSENACIISSERVRILHWSLNHKRHGEVLVSLPFRDVIKCTMERSKLGPGIDVSYVVIAFEEKVELPEDFMNSDYPCFGPTKEAPRRKQLTAQRLQCSTEQVALRLSHVLNLSKSAFDRRRADCDKRLNASEWI